MNETQRNIKALRAALPGLKERVIAVALLLAMSAAMMTSATFAWITLSRAPEVSNVSTTVAANGNLEIALVKPDGSNPAESAVGDSSAISLGEDDNPIVRSNVTWGNLVNLSDPSYGLEEIVLRPALLGNANNLLNQPLKGVDYGMDGRVQQYYNENFQFTNWFVDQSGEGYFSYSETPKYGVRAISTIKYEYTNPAALQYSKLMDIATKSRQDVEDGYNSTTAGKLGLTNNRTYLDALSAMIGTYMTDKMGGSDSDVSGHIKSLYHMLMDLYQLLVGTGAEGEKCYEDAMVDLANTMVFSHYYSENDPKAYEAHLYTRETLFAATTDELAANGVVLDSMDDYLELRSGIEEVLYGTDDTKDDSIYDFYVRVYPNKKADGSVDESKKASGVTVKLMSELLPFINKMVNIETCWLITNKGAEHQVKNIGKTVAMQIYQDLDPCYAQIQSGLLVDFEKLTGAKMCATNVKVSASYLFVSVDANAATITTTFNGMSKYAEDKAYSEAKASANQAYTAMAQDTYGMALDFWVRTNTAGSKLILEGNVLVDEVQEPEMGVDKDGNETRLYTVRVSAETTDEATGETTKIETDAVVYMLEESGKEVWYYANNHQKVYNDDGTAPEGQTISEPIPRVKITYPVIGYEGENRIWNDPSLMIDVTSTTQGSGSCYVFYADDPAQQTNSLRLLKNLRVAFIDNNADSATNGKMVAIAKLDIDNRYEESGKVTIPLVLFNDGSNYLTTMEDGLAILELDRNVPTRLTAVVFLDGRDISNTDVLAANSIQGQLNIQFGSTAELTPINDEPLQLATRSVSAVIKAADDPDEYPVRNTGPYDDSGAFVSEPDVEFDFAAGTPMKVKVRVKVEGERANRVKAFFMRKVNETQGSRGDDFELFESETEPGIYEGECTFYAPGDYVLRTVTLDGVAYDLPAKNYPRVSISGFSIQRVQLKYNGLDVDMDPNTPLNIVTDKRSITMDMEMAFATGQGAPLPSSVKLQFMKEGGTLTTTTLHYSSEEKAWLGSLTFNSSGNYTLTYAVIDDQYEELDLRYRKELDLTLGMAVHVTNGGDYGQIKYEGELIEVPMYVEIVDDSGEEIKYRTDATLTYQKNGSNINNSKLNLKWNSTFDRYECTLPIDGPGRYTFQNVKLGTTSTLTNTVNTPPTFNCASRDMPSYFDAKPMQGKDYLLSDPTTTADADAITVGVRLLDAGGAEEVIAILENKDQLGADGKPVRIEVSETGRMDSEQKVTVNGEKKIATEFTFKLPQDVNTKHQSGDWELVGLKLTGIYDAANQYHGTDKPMIMMLPTETEPRVKVTGVSGLVIDTSSESGTREVAYTDANPLMVELYDSADFAGDDRHVRVVHVNITAAGTDEALDGGYFMGSATANNSVVFTITDQKGRPLDSNYVQIANLKVTHSYQTGTSYQYGHYTASSESVEPVTVESYEVSGTTYTMGKPTFSHAGKFVISTMTFDVTNVAAGSTVTYKYASDESREEIPDERGFLNLPVYTLSTAAPTLQITAATPTGTYSIDQTTSGRLDDGAATKENEREQEKGGCEDGTETVWDWYYNTNGKHKSGYSSSISTDKKEATVYFKCDHTDEARYLGATGKTAAEGKDYHHYVYGSNGTPTVTITLSNTGKMFQISNSTATLTFKPLSGTEVRMFTKYSSGGGGLGSTYYFTEDANKTSSYTWSSETTCSRYIGSMTQYGAESGYIADRNNNDTKVPAGTITANQLVVIYNGVTYTFDIDTITINNPY